MLVRPLRLSSSLSLAHSLSLYLALVHIYIHSGELGATVAVCAHHQLSCNQPASQPARAATAANQQRRRSFVVTRNRSGNGERRIACCHDGTAKLTVIVERTPTDERSSTILSHPLFPPATAPPERDSSPFLSSLRLPPSSTLLTSLPPQPGPSHHRHNPVSAPLSLPGSHAS